MKKTAAATVFVFRAGKIQPCGLRRETNGHGVCVNIPRDLTAHNEPLEEKSAANGRY